MVSDKRKEYLDAYVEKRKRINISLSDNEFTKVSHLASLNQLKPTTYITHLVQHHLNQSPFVPKQLQAEIQEMKFLLRNVANNINQIAHRSHTLKVMVDERELLLELKRLEEGVTSFIEREMKS